MEAVQTIKLEYDERMAIQKALGIIDEISDIARCSMVDAFEYLLDKADIVDKYEYRLFIDVLQITEIG